MPTFRIERDMIGELPVPANAYYGIHTVRTCQNLSFSGRQLSRYPAYIKSMALVKKAAALANREAGELDRRLGEMIESACDRLIEGSWMDQFPVDVLHGGGGIGVNMNVNEVIANLCNKSAGQALGAYEPVHPIDHVNMSQSTSDVCHTAIRMAIMMAWGDLKRELERMLSAMEDKAKAFAPVRTISRTCMQDAMAVSWGDTFGGYCALLERRTDALAQSIDRLRHINLGGTVIGSGLGASEGYRRIVVEKLRLVSDENFVLRDNLYDAAQNPDDLAEVSAQLALLASGLLKIAKDFRLLSSGPEAGLAELVLPAVQAGSSFFPGKVNPVVPETLIQCCFQVYGCDRAVQAALEHGELNLNVWEEAAGINILDAIGMLTQAVHHFHHRCVRELKVNAERCETYAQSTVPLVASLKEEFGYTEVSRWVKEAAQKGLSLKEWLREGGKSSGTSAFGMGEGMAEDA